MPRIPIQSNFPPSITLDITPPRTGTPQNVLILLHGLGDTQTAFTRLAHNLALPETVAISLRAPTPIPAIFTGSDVPSFHWAADVLFDDTRGELDLDGDFAPAIKLLTEVMAVLGEGGCGFKDRNVTFYGFGQGAMAAVALCAVLAEREFGGVVAIGGRLPGNGVGEGRSKTPLLVCGGSRSRQVTKEAIAQLKSRFGDVEYVKWQKGEDSMPASREEMLPIMRFLARRLQSRAGVPEGAVEV